MNFATELFCSGFSVLVYWKSVLSKKTTDLVNFAYGSTLRSWFRVVEFNLSHEDHAPGDSYHFVQTVTATRWQSVVIPRATSSDYLTDWFKYSKLFNFEQKKWINENAGFEIFFIYRICILLGIKSWTNTDRHTPTR